MLMCWQTRDVFCGISAGATCTKLLLVIVSVAVAVVVAAKQSVWLNTMESVKFVKLPGAACRLDCHID